MRVELPLRRIEAVPGQPFALPVDVTNTGAVIDGYDISIVGVDPAWVRTEGAPLSLFPGDRRSKPIVITLPKDFPAGDRRLAVRIASSVYVGDVVVEEFDVVVASRFGASLRVDPKACTVGARGSLSIIVENTGNTDVNLFLEAEDEERALAFQFSSVSVAAPPGRTSSVSVRAKGRRPFFGAVKPRMITITGDDHDHTLTANATMIQRPLVPRTALALGVLLVALGAFIILLNVGMNKINKSQDRATLQAANAIAALATGANGGGSGGVTGEVTVAGSATGLSGAAVTAFPSNDPAKALSSTTSDKDGVFQLDGLKAGQYRLRFSAPGYQQVWFPSATGFDGAGIVTLVAGTKAQNVDVAMGGLPGSVTGTISGAANPAGIEVLLLSASGAAAAATTPTSPTTTAPAASTAANVSFRFDNGTSSGSGSVSPGGAVPSGALVAVTDASGVFKFPTVPTPAAYLIEATAPGYGVTTVGVTLGAAENKVAPQVVLNPQLGSIAGIVTAGPIGTPLDGVTVTASVNGTNLTALTLTQPVPGFYTLSGLPVPGSYEVSYVKPGYQTVIQLVVLQPGVIPPNTNVVLSPSSGTLSGVVTGIGGQPLAGATVTATSADGKTVLITTTAVQPPGAYALGNMAAGPFTVAFSNKGYATTTVGITVTAGQPQTKSVALTGDGSIGGIVSNCAGAPAPGVTVNVLLNGAQVGSATTSATGAFLVNGLVTPNIYTVQFPSSPGPSGFVVVVLGAAQSRTDIAWPTAAACPPPTTTSTSTTVAPTTTAAPATTTTSSTLPGQGP